MPKLTDEDLRILENNPFVILIENLDQNNALIFREGEPEAAFDYWESLENDDRPMSINNFGLTMATRNQTEDKRK